MQTKNIKAALFFLSSIIVLFSCKAKKDPVEYHNKIMTIMNASETDMSSMNSAMQTNNYEKAKEVGVKWVATIDKGIKEIEELGDCNGDVSYKNTVVNSLKMYKDVVTVQYPNLIKEREGIKSGTITSQVNEDKILDVINNQMDKAGNDVNVASAEFEKKIYK